MANPRQIFCGERERKIGVKMTEEICIKYDRWPRCDFLLPLESHWSFFHPFVSQLILIAEQNGRKVMCPMTRNLEKGIRGKWSEEEQKWNGPNGAN